MPDRCPTGVFGAAVSAEGEVTPLTVHQILEPSLFVFLLIATYLSYCCKGGVSLAEPVPGVYCLLFELVGGASCWLAPCWKIGKPTRLEMFSYV